MLRFRLLILILILLAARQLNAQYIHPDSTEQVLKELARRKQSVEQRSTTNVIKVAGLMAENEFRKAELLIDQVLKAEPNNQKALLLQAELHIQAWKLPQAAEIAKKAMKNNIKDAAAELLLGRVWMLQKNYNQALELAKSVQQRYPYNAAAFLLEADVYFWNQQPEKAERPLFRSLELNPFNADARFSYGYAIWRRIDATQLKAMAAQWEVALAIDPLHFQTNWHWGNGHTQLTYADYAEKDDEDLRKALQPADDLLRKNDIAGAIALIKSLEKSYPNSVLPKMHRASVYYSLFDGNRGPGLDTAQQLFLQVLRMKQHYGPAHNGLAAVIKAKRMPYLAAYDSITAVLKNIKIADDVNFRRVFPDVHYYPGEKAKAMVWNQLYTSVVYFPFLSRQGDVFRIPPLHEDLAITMKSPSFRFMTTFDNRQWMDIRGVGSGAAAIEYAEKGAYMERNVVLHEYVHLFHGEVLTDAENRKIRALYYQAMKEGRTLDYYSRNNESEYFAQTYPAYFEPVKVHPQDFKSMNTRADLMAKDPQMFAFIDQLVRKEKAYLAGDQKAMASNWAEVYVKLSAKAGNSFVTAEKYLDTALKYDAEYLPAYLGMAQCKRYQKDFKAAEKWLHNAKRIDSAYAPLYSAYAALVAARFADQKIVQKEAVILQSAYLNRALALEDDAQELAKYSQQLREMYYRNAMIPEAVRVADDYVRTGSALSTYLRDRKDDALVFAASCRLEMGEQGQAEILGKLVSQKPQNFEYRNKYADALAAEKNYGKAINILKEAQRILQASGNARSDYNMRIAEFYQAMGRKDSAQIFLKPLLDRSMGVRKADELRYFRLLLATGNPGNSTMILENQKQQGDAAYLAELYYTLACFQQAGRISGSARSSLEKAVAISPFFLKYRQVTGL